MKDFPFKRRWIKQKNVSVAKKGRSQEGGVIRYSCILRKLFNDEGKAIQLPPCRRQGGD
jgi:hypothetical protein